MTASAVAAPRTVGWAAHRSGVWALARAWPRVEVLAAGAALGAILARVGTGAHPVDDAFITFRYARNAALGLGLVYNSGEAVLGTTTPLWAALLALGYRLGFTDLPTLATVLAALGDGASAALLALMAARLGLGRAGALVGVAWALNPMSVAYAAGGMETSLFVLAVLGAVALVAKGQVAAAGLLAGLAVAVRPEGLLLAAAVAVAGFLSGGPAVPWRRRLSGLGAALPVGLYGLWLWTTYGMVVPQSALAKQVAYVAQPGWLSLAVLALQAGLPGWSTFFPSLLPLGLAFPLAALGLATLVLLTVALARAPSIEGRVWLPLALFGALYLAFHAAVGLRGGRLFPWYLVPLIPLYLLLAAGGLAALTRRASTWRGAGLTVLLVWQVMAISPGAPLLPVGFDLGREHLYQEVGTWLATRYPPSTTLAAPEIGALGYTSGLRVLDTVGLVSPRASAYYPLPPEMVVGDQAIPPRLIANAAPDLVVTLDQFAARSLLPDPGFQARYTLERRWPAPIWSSTELLVYRRIDAPAPVAVPAPAPAP